ncbi:hypothetical protein N7533_011413 [Penicillium manginii]|uniref:uncharacterized protein n=1 Tax=Penicillium manginii TaxID=203109 RepID=UPI0025477550|nr:uncharacterized protein N7533_011413 [Penicillium manginii]KAJ5742004.1 hypothetical protein N7533_011413 [Penicillium manginii]
MGGTGGEITKITKDLLAREIGKDGVTGLRQSEDQSAIRSEVCAGLRQPFISRPERRWRAFPGAPSGPVELTGQHRAGAGWAVMLRLSVVGIMDVM